MKAINNANGKNLPETPTLMFEFIGTGSHISSSTDIGILLSFVFSIFIIDIRHLIAVFIRLSSASLFLQIHYKLYSFIFFWHSEAYSREQTKIVQKIVSEHNGSDFVFAEEPEAKKELWKVLFTSLFPLNNFVINGLEVRILLKKNYNV